jgi:hypothetical protein
VEAHRVVRHSHIFKTAGSQMAVRLLALYANRHLPPGRFLELISVRVLVDPSAIVLLEGLGQLKKSNILIGNPTRDLQVCSIMPQPINTQKIMLRIVEEYFWAILRFISTAIRT